MKKLFLLVVLVSLICLVGCSSTPPVVEKGTVCLWKLEKGKTVVYLLGSIHLGVESIYPLAEQINQAYAESDKLVVEFNSINTDNLQAVQKYVIEKGMFSGTEVLGDYAQPQTLEKIKEEFALVNVPFETAQKFKPWVVEAFVSQVEMAKLGFDPALGIDIHFLNKAKEQSKEIIELETVEEQITMMSDVPIKDQLLSLEFTINDLNSIPAYMNNLVTYWQTGDHVKLADLIMQSFSAQPEFKNLYNRLFTVRNIAWEKKIEKLIAKGGKYFIVVGVGHLVGEGSVPALLIKKGFKIKQL